MTTEIDLIPSDYRARQWQRGFTRQVGVALVCVVVTTAVSMLYLNRSTAAVREEIATVEARRSVTREQRAELERLSQQRSEYEQQLSLLKGLRSGASADALFTAVDRALGDHPVWFSTWQLQRAGVLVSDAQAGTASADFIVLPEGSALEDGPWQVETRMLIRGQAGDHAALSKVVDGLFAQPGVVDVRVRQTTASWHAQQRIVEFELDVVLNSSVE